MGTVQCVFCQESFDLAPTEKGRVRPDCEVIIDEGMEALKEIVLEAEVERLEREFVEAHGMTFVEWRIAQLSKPMPANREDSIPTEWEELLPPPPVQRRG